MNNMFDSKIDEVQKSILSAFELGINNGNPENYQNTEEYKKLAKKLFDVEVKFKNDMIALEMNHVSIDQFDTEFAKRRADLNNDSRPSEKYRRFCENLDDLVSSSSIETTNDQANTTTFVDEMEVNEALSTIDPISKGQIRNPVRNKICKHIYDRDTIKEALKSSESKRVRCPFVGCSNKKHIQLTDLVEDRELKRKMQQQRKQQETQEESD